MIRFLAIAQKPHFWPNLDHFAQILEKQDFSIKIRNRHFSYSIIFEFHTKNQKKLSSQFWDIALRKYGRTDLMP